MVALFAYRDVGTQCEQEAETCATILSSVATHGGRWRLMEVIDSVRNVQDGLMPWVQGCTGTVTRC